MGQAGEDTTHVRMADAEVRFSCCRHQQLDNSPPRLLRNGSKEPTANAISRFDGKQRLELSIFFTRTTSESALWKHRHGDGKFLSQ